MVRPLYADCYVLLADVWLTRSLDFPNLQIVNNTYPPGQGEPLNVIVSGDSDPQVLVDSLDNGGFQNYMLCVWCTTSRIGNQKSSTRPPLSLRSSLSPH